MKITMADLRDLAGGAHAANASIPVSEPLVERASIANLGQAERIRSRTLGYCRDLNASFLDPACHLAELHKQHSSHAGHRIATALIGRADARDPEAE
jgi:hypothetical protein